MASSINVGQTLPMTIQYLDAAGNVLTGITPDAAPAWSDTTPASDTLTAAADGNSATALGLAAGSDTISVALSVKGTPFSAELALTVVQPAPPPPVVASIAIVPGAPTP